MLTAPPHLSPSSINTFQQCPLKFKFSKIDGLMEPPTVHTLLGNFVHDILESLYNLSIDQRTMPVARALARSHWEETYEAKVESLSLNKHDFRWKAWRCVENLYKIEDPIETCPAGIEYEVNGQIEGVTVKGFIDRFEVLDDNTLLISDYKTGKVPSPKYMDDKFQQLFIYAAMVDALGVGSASRVSLMYLVAPKVLSRDVTQESIEATVETIVSTKKQIDIYCEEENFPAKQSGLCNFCHFKKMCPAWVR